MTYVQLNRIFSLILKIIMSASANVFLLSLPGSSPSPSHIPHLVLKILAEPL